MSSVTPFTFEGVPVRIVDRDGNPWFVLADVCRVLDIALPHRAADRLDDDEKRKVDLGVTNATGAKINDLGMGSGNNEAWIISESGLYSLVLTSRKPEARRFRRWVTAEVLPTIRRSGGYMLAGPEESPEELAARAITVLQATIERQKAKLAEVAPKGAALDIIAASEGSLNITVAAKTLQLPPKELFHFLHSEGWIYRREERSEWTAAQTRLNSGDLVDLI